MSDDARVSVLFVCLGNICRSPTAEGVMRALVREAGLQERIELDSAGTGGWHVGESPDARATEAAGRRGIALEGAARKVRPRDFEEFDLILAMDASNLRDLQAFGPRRAGAGEGEAAARVGAGGIPIRRRPRRAGPLLRRAGRLRRGARPCAGILRLAAPAAAESPVSLPPGATNARRVGGGDINEAWRVTLADGREAFVKTRPDAGPEEYAAEARGLQWLAEPGALRTPRVLEVAEDYLVLEWVQQGSLSADGAEELGRGLALTHAAARARSAVRRLRASDGGATRPRASARCDSPTTPRPTGRPSTPSAACSRWRGSPASAAPSRSAERTRSRRCASACPSLPARPSRPRGCTGICGAAT